MVTNGGSTFRDWQRNEGTFRSDGNVLYHDRGLKYTDAHTCQNSESVYLELVYFPICKCHNFLSLKNTGLSNCF